ncbi:MAG: site-specific integrase [Thaumarchaeota archaeon]|nr:site-specific integrase [Nitrososphaerota archaeon]
MIDREKINDLGYLNVYRNREGFLTNKFNKSKSTSTVDFCNNALLSFDRFVFSKFGKDSTEQVINEIKKLPESRHESIMIDMFQKYLHWKHEDSKASTAIAYYQTTVEYFSYHQLRINQYNQRRDITLPKDPKNMKHALTISEIRKLVDYSKPERKALYTVLVSSGMRIGETLGLRKRDFDFSQDRICITIPGKLTKMKMQRQTYISKEAEHYLAPIIKRMSQDELVFSLNKNNKKAVDNEVLNFWYLRKKAELDMKYDDSKYHKISLHSFRSFFETQASNTHGLEYAHALIGHSGYLEQYYRLSEEERLEKYIELEPKLTIGEDFRNGIKIQKLEIDKSELEKIRKQMHDERILTLKMIGEAMKDPKKFQEKLEKLSSV